MKRLALATLTAAVAFASANVQADDRYDDDDRRYDQHDDRYGDGRYGDDRYGERRYESTDIAQVVSVDPIVDRSQPRQRQECWREPVQYRGNDRYDRRGDDRNVGAGIVGGIIGGVLGNQVGKGDGRKVTTTAGAVIGYQIGKSVARHDDKRYRDNTSYRSDDYRGETVERCRMVDDGYEERVIGYNVTYTYAGKTYRTVTDTHPGRTLRVRVAVQPIERSDIAQRY